MPAKSERVRLLTPMFRVSFPDVFVKRVFQGQGEDSGRYACAALFSGFEVKDNRTIIKVPATWTPKDQEKWKALIAAKHKPGDFVLSDADRDTLLDWLAAKFGPETKPFPRTYIPPEITTFFSDPEAKRLLDRACTSCHGLDRVQSARNPEEAWRVILVDMRERGAKLSDEELERLTEWLGRVWGTNQDK